MRKAACVCVFLRVSVRERQREREMGVDHYRPAMPSVSKKRQIDKLGVIG